MKQVKSNENVKIETTINESAFGTVRFFDYISEKIAECEPFRKGDFINVWIQENNTPFPVFSVNLLDHDKNAYIGHKVEDAQKDLGGKTVAIWDSLNKVFEMGVVFRLPELEKKEPLTFNLPIIAYDKNRFHNAWNKIKIKLDGKNGSHQKKDLLPPIFDLDHKKMTWGEHVFNIKEGKYPYYICKVASDKPVGENISWDFVLEEIDDPLEDKETITSRDIYFSLKRFNNRVEQKTHKQLFSWTGPSFRRNY